MTLVLLSLLGCHGLLAPRSPLPTPRQLMMSVADSEDALQLVVQSGHAETPLRVAGSPDGTLVATADASGLVLLWSAQEGRQLKLLSGAGRPAAMEWWSPPGETPRLLVLDGTGKLHVFSPYTGQHINLDIPDNILSISVSPDGRRLAAGAALRTWLVDADGSASARRGGGVAIALTPRRLVTVDRRGRLQSESLTGSDAPIRWEIEAPPDVVVARGRWVITADQSSGVCAWKTTSARALWCAPVDGLVIDLLALSEDRLLVTTARDGAAQTELWSMRAGPLRDSAGRQSAVISTASSPPEALERAHRFSQTLFEGAISAASSGDDFVLGYTDGYAVRYGAKETRFDRSVSLGQTVVFGGRMLLVGGAGDGQTIWDTSHGRFVQRLSTPGARAADLSADGSRLAVATSEGQLELYSPGSVEATHREVDLSVSRVALSADGESALLADDAGGVQLIDLSADPAEATWKHTLREPATLLSMAGPVMLAATEGGAVVTRPGPLLEAQTFQVRWARLSDAQLSADGSVVLLSGTVRKGRDWVGAVWCYRLDGSLVWSWETTSPVLAVSVLDSDTALISTADARMCTLHLTEQRADCPEPAPDATPMASLSFSNSGLLAGGRVDGGAQLWSTNAQDLALRLVGFAGGEGASWAVIAPSSRAYDASFAGDIDSVYWVLSATEPEGLESFPLSRLKSDAYRPQLLSDFLHDRLILPEPQPLPQPPGITLLQAPDPADGAQARLRACLTPRSGGLGTITIRLNGREIATRTPDQLDATESCPLLLSYPLTEHLPLLTSENDLSVLAWDATDTVAGQPLQLQFRGPRPPQDGPIASSGGGIPRVRVTVPSEGSLPGLFVLVVGISDYPGALQLTYPARDAEAVAETLRRGAEVADGSPVLFDPVVIRTLTGDDVNGVSGILRAAREMIDEQSPEDIFGIYLAGHGLIDAAGEWHFLTRDATPDNLTAENALSSTALTALLQTAPARHQAIVLDTCAAGQAAESVLTSQESRTSVLTLERMKDRTGLLILAASSGDELAYESTELGHGLLTAGLLHGLKNEQLAGLHDNYLWYIGTLFDYAANEVPRLAERVGIRQRQQPVVARPAGNDFHIGRWHEEVGNELSLPVVAPAVLMSRQPLGDPLSLSASVSAALSEAAGRQSADVPGAFLFTESSSYSSVLRLWGLYELRDGQVELSVALLRGDEQLASENLEYPVDDVEAALAAWVQAKIEADHAR